MLQTLRARQEETRVSEKKTSAAAEAKNDSHVWMMMMKKDYLCVAVGHARASFLGSSRASSTTFSA
jgi:hypothetical protein